MLQQAFISACIASTYTAMFTFRFQKWDQPRVVVASFLAFFSVEVAVEWLIVPPGAFGVEIGFVCLFLTGLIVETMVVAHRLEGKEED